MELIEKISEITWLVTILKAVLAAGIYVSGSACH